MAIEKRTNSCEGESGETTETKRETTCREDTEDVTVEDGKNDDERKEKKGKRRKRKSEVEIPDDGVPYDRGWAWMIVVGGFMNFVLIAGYNRGTFIFFVNFLEEFRAPVTETALLFGVKAAVNSVVGLFIMNAVLGRFGVRRTVLVGGVCLSLSAILGSLARSVTTLILFQSVFHGLGMSMLGMPATVLLGFYFRRRRSLAMSITKCGVGAGAVAFPPIVTYLLNQYGLRGALLVMGGICLNTVVAASLLRPTSFYKKRKQLRCSRDNPGKLQNGAASDEHRQKLLDSSSDDKRCEEVRENGSAAERSLMNGKAAQGDVTDLAIDTKVSFKTAEDSAPEVAAVKHEHAGQNGGSTVVVIEENGLPVSVRGPDGERRTLVVHRTKGVTMLSRSTPDLHLERTFRPRTLSVNDQYYSPQPSSPGIGGSVLDVLNRSHLARYLSRADLEHDTPCLAAPSENAPATDEKDAMKKRTCLHQTWRIVKKIFGVLDFSLFHSPMFRALVVFFIMSPMLGAVSTYLPAMAKERGLDENERALLLSIIGGLDFCCRLLCGFIADTKIMRVSTMIGVAFIVLGVMCQMTRLLTSFSLLVVLAVAHGMLGGVAACVMPILIMEDIGLDNTAKAMGFNKLFSGAAMAAFHPLLGYIRDTTGSYDVAYNVIGAFTLVSAITILSVRFLPHTLPTDEKEEVIITRLKDDDTESSPLNQESKNISLENGRL